MWPTGLRVSVRALETTIDAMITADLIEPDQRAKAFGVLTTDLVDQR